MEGRISELYSYDLALVGDVWVKCKVMKGQNEGRWMLRAHGPR